VNLGQAGERQARQLAGQRSQRRKRGIVIKNAIVDLIGEQQKIAPCGQCDDARQQLARVGRAGRIVRIDQHDRARAGSAQRFHFIRVRKVRA